MKDDPMINALHQLNSALNPESISNISLLTNREQEVFALIGNRQTTIEIATMLGLSPSTVETHRKNIRRKLKLRGKGKLFEYALLANLFFSQDFKLDDK